MAGIDGSSLPRPKGRNYPNHAKKRGSRGIPQVRIRIARTSAPHGRRLEAIRLKMADHEEETDGAIREWHDNGRIKKIMRLKNGKPDETCVVYFESGKPFIEGSFSKGKRTSHWKRFYETGELKSSGSYEDGKRTGWHALRREDGKTLKLFFHKG